MKYFPLIALSVPLFIPVTLSAKCPVLDLSTLPKALCASEKSPLTQAGGNMAYVSTRASKPGCSKDAIALGVRKTMQSIFKGKKDYNGDEKITQNGLYACDYTFPVSWKESLGTKDDKFTLTAKVIEAVNSGIAGKSLCPSIDWKTFRSIEGGASYSVKMGIVSGGQTLVWDLAKKLDKKFLSKVLGAKTPSDTKDLVGTPRVEVPFKNECTYTYHPAGVEEKLILMGTHVK